MKVSLLCEQETKDNGLNTVMISQDDIEYIGDFAEVLLQFTRAVGYGYISRVILVKDNGDEVATF